MEDDGYKGVMLSEYMLIMRYPTQHVPTGCSSRYNYGGEDNYSSSITDEPYSIFGFSKDMGTDILIACSLYL